MEGRGAGNKVHCGLCENSEKKSSGEETQQPAKIADSHRSS